MSGSTRSIYEVLDESLLVEYCIRTRTFDQFKKIFKTNKYLSRNYYIMVNLQNEIFNVPAFLQVSSNGMKSARSSMSWCKSPKQRESFTVGIFQFHTNSLRTTSVD